MQLLINLGLLILVGGAAGVLTGLMLDAVRPDHPDWLRTVVIGAVAGAIAGGGAVILTNPAVKRTEV